jgi:hypothetical protein
MKKNLSNTDRLVRVFIAAIVAILYYTGNIYGTTGIILLVAAGVLFATTLIGFCPLYAILGISSCKVKKPGTAL